MMNQLLLPFLFTLFAGLCTGIGGAIAFFSRTTNKKFLSFSMGLSAGVMIYISFVEMLSEAQVNLQLLYGPKVGPFYAIVCFFAGMGLIALIDKLVPDVENPHEVRLVEEMTPVAKSKDKRLMRMGLMTAIAISIHNFPEGIATFMSGVNDPNLGMAVAVAVAIHNVPEGIAISVPIYHATGNRKKAFFYSFLSGLAEPVGALLAYFLLMPFMSDTLLSCVFAAVAGIMVFISFDELLPASREYGEHHISIYGLFAGMGIMAISLVLLM